MFYICFLIFVCGPQYATVLVTFDFLAMTTSVTKLRFREYTNVTLDPVLTKLTSKRTFVVSGLNVRDTFKEAITGLKLRRKSCNWHKNKMVTE